MISTNYFELREDFRNAATAKGAQLTSFPIEAKGPQGEELTIDIAWMGSPNATQAVLHIIGTHGVEGYFGSVIQSSIISKRLTLDPDTAVMFLHGLNPWGMAHSRRVNESNVDLNRNFFIDANKYTGAPEGYGALNSFLNPLDPPIRVDLFYIYALINLIKYGYTSVKQAIGLGQYEYPKGIYFGGKRMEESLKIFKDFLETHLVHVKTLKVIEVHSGLGKWGEDVLFFNSSASESRTKKFLFKLDEEITSDDPGEVGFKTQGDLQHEIPLLLPNTETFWILQEFGAYNTIQTLKAIRTENQYYQSGGRELNHWSKEGLREVFCPQSEEWQSKVVKRGIELFEKVLSGSEEE